MWRSILYLNSKWLTNTRSYIHVRICFMFWLQHDLLPQIAFLSGVLLSCTSYHAFFMSREFIGCMYVCVCDMHLCLSCSSVCWRIYAWKAKNAWKAQNAVHVDYIYLSCISSKQCFWLRTFPLIFFSPFLFYVRGLPPSNRSLTVLKDTRVLPAGLGFLLCSHSTWVPQGPRWNEIHIFKIFSCKYAHFTAGCCEALQIEQRQINGVIVYQNVIVWNLAKFKEQNGIPLAKLWQFYENGR